MIGHAALAVRADVEQVGAAAADGGNEAVEHLFRVLPVLVVPGVGPGIVGGIAGFPEAIDVARRHFHVALAGIVAHAVADAAAEQGVGLGLADEVGEFDDEFLGHVAGGVEPDETQRAVLGADFLHLRVTFFAEVLFEGRGFAVGVFAGAAAAAGGGPVLVVRVVESEAEARFTAGGGEFLHRIAFEGRGIHDVEGVGGFEHGESFVMLRGDDDVFHPGGFGDAGDLLGVEFGGIEFAGEGHVFGIRDFHLALDPLADAVKRLVLPLAAEVGKQAPVDEHAVVAIAENGDAVGFFVAGFD